jgi:hypothetical protein
MAIPYIPYGTALSIPLGAYSGYRFGRDRNNAKFAIPEMAIGGATYYGTDKAVTRLNKLLQDRVVRNPNVRAKDNVNINVSQAVEDMLKKRGVKTKRKLPNIKIKRPSKSAANIASTLLGFIAAPGATQAALETYQKMIPKTLSKRQAHRKKYDVK